jgi:hypothetical protein
MSPLQGLPPLWKSRKILLHSAAVLRCSTFMQLPVRWLFLAAGILTLAHADAAPKLSSEDLQHMREELGVNDFTAPSIDIILKELEALKPIPYDKIWRDPSESMPQDRARLALYTGAVIADGFLAVASEKQKRIETAARALLRLSKGLGVSDRIAKHSRSILEKSARGQWNDVKQELVRAQAEVEAAMLGLKDEEIAHLIALGGWLRGLEMTSDVVLDDYSADRARRLIQPELLDYFIDRVATLNPNIKATKAGRTIEKNLQQAKLIITKPVDVPIEKEEVRKIRDLAKEMSKAIVNGDE